MKQNPHIDQFNADAELDRLRRAVVALDAALTQFRVVSRVIRLNWAQEKHADTIRDCRERINDQ